MAPLGQEFELLIEVFDQLHTAKQKTMDTPLMI